jgi:thiol-disulfide isomerase/thioredoxin
MRSDGKKVITKLNYNGIRAEKEEKLLMTFSKRRWICLLHAVVLFIFTACAAGTSVPLLETQVSAAVDSSDREEPAEEITEKENVPEQSHTVFGFFELEDLNGNGITQDIFSEGELTLVNIWATFCGPCLQEMPDLEKMNQNYADRGFQVVGIPVDLQDSNGELMISQLELVREIVEKTGATYPNILLSDIPISVTAVPTTVFVDSQGNQVGEVVVGARSYTQWEIIVNQLLDNL